MSLLSYVRLRQLVLDGTIQYSEARYINSTSIDIRLGRKVKVEALRAHTDNIVSIYKRDSLSFEPHDLIEDGSLLLYPGQFILAQSIEQFNLPNNISAEYKLKSSLARVGLEHLTAGWCDAGWHGSVLTLELKNITQYHRLKLEYGMPIGQIVFFEHEEVPEEASYAARGRYNNNVETTEVIK